MASDIFTSKLQAFRARKVPRPSESFAAVNCADGTLSSLLCICLILALFLPARTCLSGEEFTARMRVGLSRFASASELTLRAEPGARLLDAQGRERAAGGGPFVLSREGKSVIARDSQGH